MTKMNSSANDKNLADKKQSQHRRFIRINGKLISKTFSRKTDADRWYAEIKRQKEYDEAGLDFETPGTLLSDYTEKWLSTRRSNGQPLSSYIQDESRIRLYINPVFGYRAIDKIRTPEWEKLLNSLGPRFGLGPATKNRIRSLMSKLYNDALRERLVRANPITLIPKARETNRKWDYWAEASETSRYLHFASTEGAGFEIFASLALNTGARVSELLALENQDIDLLRGRIRIWRIVETASSLVCERTKGSSERWLGINEPLLRALQKKLDASSFQKPHHPVIANEMGERLLARAVRAKHLKVCKLAEIRPIRVHDLRHTFASHYVMNGGSLTELQGLLGHTSSAMTLKYAHMAPGFLEKRASVVSFGIEEAFEPKRLVIAK